MSARSRTMTMIITLVAILPLAIAAATEGEQPTLQQETQIPGEYIRRASNPEAVVVLGYRLANGSEGKEWLLLEIATTVMPGHTATIERHEVTLTLPDGTVFPMASLEEFQSNAGRLRGLHARADVMREDMWFLPPSATVPYDLGFFPDPTREGSAQGFNQVTLTPQSFSRGRIYFRLPNRIQFGDHVLNVGFDQSTLKVPFRIMTKAEAKAFKKKWKKMR